MLEHSRFRCFLLLSALALVAATASATTQKLRNGGDLVTAADAVVLGRCSAVATEWRDRALATRYTITVEEALKGDVGTEISVWVPGGIDRDRKIPIAVTVPGAPTLFAGEEVLLFLVLAPEAGGYSLVNLAQGKFAVQRGTGEEAWLRLGTEGAPARRNLEAVKAEIRSFVETAARKEEER